MADVFELLVLPPVSKLVEGANGRFSTINRKVNRLNLDSKELKKLVKSHEKSPFEGSLREYPVLTLSLLEALFS